MPNLKRAIIPGIAGVTIGALLAGAFWTSGGNNTTALAAPSAVSPAATSSRSTSFQMVNMGTANAQATVKFFNAADATLLSYQPSRPLAPGQSTLLDQRGDNSIPNGFAGSAVAESSQRLAAVVFEFTADGGQDAYNALGSDEVSNTSICPILLKNIQDQAGRSVNSIAHVQNAGSGSTTVTAEFVGLNGAVAHTENATLAAGVSKAFALETMAGVGANFIGSANFKSDGQPLAAAVEQYGARFLLDYTCEGAGARDVAVPLSVNLDEFRTSTIVANAANSPAEVTLTFTNFDNASVVVTDTIPARSAGFYDQGFAMGPLGKTLPKPFFGNLRVTSSQDVSIIAQQLSRGDVQQLSFRGVAVNKLATKIVLPSIFSQITDPAGIVLSTAFAVYNPGTAQADLNISFQPASGGAAQNVSKSVGAGKLESYEQRPNLANSIFATAGNFGSITITSSQPVVVVSQQLSAKNQEGPEFKDPIAGYMGIPGQ